jgi:hypothetical protein
MPQNEYSPKSLDLTCPHCGGKLDVIMERNANPLEREYYPDGLECETNSCGATWDLLGNQTQDPNWVKWPEKFNKPEKKEEQGNNG